MDDNQIDVRITASSEDFKTGMDAASSQVQSSVAAMKQGMGSMGTQVSASMKQVQAATNSAMQGMNSSISGTMSRITSTINGMKAAVGAASIAIVGVFGSSTKAALEYEKSLLMLSRTSGMSVAASSEMAFAASQVGINTDDLTRNIGFLSRSLGNLEKDAGSSSNIFNRFGINVHDANGKLLPTQDVLGKIADKFKSMPDGVQKTSLAMSIFGREGRTMIPLLNQGSAGLEKMGEKARQLGLVFNNVSALKAYVQAQRQWEATLKSLQVQIGNAVLPILTTFAKTITNLLQAFNQLNPEFRQTIITVAAVAASVAALTLGWGAAAAAIAAFGGPFASIGTAMTNMPNIVTACTTAVKGFVVGLAEGTINMVKYVASGQALAAAHGVLSAAVASARAILVGMRTTIVAVSLAYQVGGVKAIASYCASLVTMRGVIAIARTALIALYATVTAGIAVVVALAAAWVTDFGDIQEATAGTCDGIITGLNSFADGVGQIMSGIGQIFVSLANTIASALNGDFSGAIDQAKGMLEGVKNVGAGAWGAMKGFHQTFAAVAMDPGGAWNFLKAGAGAVWNGAKNIMGLNDSPASADDGSSYGGDGGGDFGNSGNGGNGGSGGGDGTGGAGGKGEAEESAYERQKKLYEQQIQLAEYSAQEKEALYKSYLETVAKSDKETVEYKIGLYQLDKEAFAEKLQDQETELDNQHTQGKASEESYQSALTKIKEANLDAEVEFRAKAAQEASKVSGNETQMELSQYKEKIKQASWYKEALKDVLDAKKKLADYELSVGNKILEYQNDQTINALAVEEKKQEGLYNLGAITQEQLLAMQRSMEDQKYNIQREYAEKGLSDNAIDADKMKRYYQNYVNARTDMDRETYLNAMLMNSQNEETTLSSLKSLEELYAQHSEKMLDITQKEKTKQLQIITNVKNTLADNMSSIMQDVAKGNKSILEGLRSLWTSTMSSILKQITDQISSNIVQKAFQKYLTPNAAAEKQAVAAEQAAQAARTAAAQTGMAQRTMVEQTGGQMQVAATEQKAAVQIGLETTKDATIIASSTTAATTAVAATQASITSMLEMLPVLLIVSALSGLFGGGGSSTSTSDGPSINLGRSPDSYYKTPTLTGIPSFDVGSWRIPQDTLAMVHKDEMIVPAKGGGADGVRSMLSNGGSQAAPQINLSYSAVHTGRTNADVRQEMKENAKFMVKVLDTEYRKFNRGTKK